MRIFIAAEYMEMSHFLGSAAVKLKAMGWHVVRGSDVRTRSEMRYERHDVCLQRIDKVPYFLVLIGGLVGSMFRGKQRDYRRYHGLRTTHAEIRRSLDTKLPGKWFCFVKHEVLVACRLWEQNRSNRIFDWKPIDKRVFRWITEIRKRGGDAYPFDDWDDLEMKLEQHLSPELGRLNRKTR